MKHRLFVSSSQRIRALLASAALASCTGSAAQMLSLAEAQAIAARESPSLAAQEAAVRAAREARIGASELPDPKLVAGIENLPIEGGDRFSLTRDFMTMRKVGVVQDFVNAGKRQARGDRAEAEARKEVAMLAAAGANLQRDVALAWVETWIAKMQLDTLRGLEREAALGLSAAEAALAGGKGQASEPLGAEIVVSQLADRMIDARRATSRARAHLARWIGDAATRPLGEPPEFTRLPHRHSDLLGNLEDHPHLAMYAPMQAMADAEVRLAEAAKRPDWSLEVAYAQRGPAYSNMISVGVSIDLPIFEARRQNPAIASRLAAAEQVRAQAEDARRAHLADIAALLADWEAAVERVRRCETEQIPLARARADAALAAYRGGKAELSTVLEARRGTIEAQLMHVQASGDMARAWAQLTFLLPPAAGKVSP